jgi:hypothetical protein
MIRRHPPLHSGQVPERKSCGVDAANARYAFAVLI